MEIGAESRSTSAGSRESGRNNLPVPGNATCPRSLELPDYEYPVPFVIRNTFIETKVGRPESLDEFYEERRIHSCPAAEFESQGLGSKALEPDPLRRALTTGAHALMTKVSGCVAGFWADAEQSNATGFEGHINSHGQMPRVLMLSEALPQPDLTYECPTVGSAGHYNGTCKPCAFLYTKGCQNGMQCEFCHLCPPTEKRRRQKEKQAMFREMRRQRRQMAL